MRRVAVAISLGVLLVATLAVQQRRSVAATGETVQQEDRTDLDNAIVAEFLRNPDAFDAESNNCRFATTATTCIRTISSPAEAARGIARFGVGTAPEGGGFLDVLGRTAAGGWGWWFGTQQESYRLLSLPGPMQVCAGGDDLNVRTDSSTDTPVAAVLSDRTMVQAEEFVLTRAGIAGPGGDTGEGWYRLSAPAGGWAFERFLSDARLPDCRFHDMVLAPRP